MLSFRFVCILSSQLIYILCSTEFYNIWCYDINGEDFLGYTPLVWASHNGHEEVVKLLLEWEEVNSDKPDGGGRTPLSYSAGGGHEGVVKLLLEREEVNPDRPNVHGRTPLSHAANGGSEGVVKLLLEREGQSRRAG